MDSIYPCIVSGQAGATSEAGSVVVSAIYVEKDFALPLLTHIQSISTKKKSHLIPSIVPSETVLVSPSKYNSLVDSTENTDEIITWLHTRAIRNLISCYKSTKTVFTGEGAPIELIKENLGKQFGTLSVFDSSECPAGFKKAARVLAATRWAEDLMLLLTEVEQLFPIKEMESSQSLYNFIITDDKKHTRNKDNGRNAILKNIIKGIGKNQASSIFKLELVR